MGVILLNHKTINARKGNIMSQSKYKNMTTEQIIADLDIVEKAIEYHYKIENEAFKTDDVYDDQIFDFITEELAENDNGTMEYEQYEKIAREIMDIISDDLVIEILKRDHDAMEDANEINESRKGQY